MLLRLRRLLLLRLLVVALLGVSRTVSVEMVIGRGLLLLLLLLLLL